MSQRVNEAKEGDVTLKERMYLLLSNPVAALEIRRRSSTWKVALAVVGLTALMSLLPVVVYGIWGGDEPPDEPAGFGFLLLTAGAALLVSILCLVVPSAAVAITKEREQATIDHLVMLPISRTKILLGKLASVLFYPVLATLALLPLMSLSFWMGGVMAGQWLVVGGWCLLCQLFFAVVGLFFSCLCKRSRVSVALSYAAALWFGFGGIGLILLDGLLQNFRQQPNIHLLTATLNPVYGLVSFFFPEPELLIGDLPAGIIIGIGYLLLGSILFAISTKLLRS